MKHNHCTIIGARVQTGASQDGCLMGPDAFRTAGLGSALTELGLKLSDKGDVMPEPVEEVKHPNGAIHDLEATIGWISALEDAAYSTISSGQFPIFLGGDHSISAGTVSGVTRYAAEKNRPQFLLWLDAHPDLHTLDSTESGNLHGTPMAYLCGQPGFDEVYPPISNTIAPERICLIGLRSVDPAERVLIETLGFRAYDMRMIDEMGIAAPLRSFLEEVKAADGCLHVSLDVDFLDPSIAPGVGTTVPGGATFREAHLVMEMLHDSGVVTSLDLVELNPFLDERGRTAKLMVDLTASLFGRRIFDRKTRSFG